MKKLSIVLAAAIVLSVTACAGATGDNKPSGDVTTPAATAAKESAETAQAPQPSPAAEKKQQ